MKPVFARFIVIAFIGISIGISINAVFLQKSRELAQQISGQPPAKLTVNRQKTVKKLKKTTVRKTPKTTKLPLENKDVSHVASVKPPAKDQLEAKIRAVLKTRSAQPQSIIHVIQQHLLKLGYFPGEADGIAGPTTQAAIMAYEFDLNLPQTGLADREIYAVMRGKKAKPERPQRPEQLKKNAQKLIAALQTALTKLGYDTGGVDGVLGPLTRKRIRSFERDHKLEVTGRISGRLIEAIHKVQGRPLLLAIL